MIVGTFNLNQDQSWIFQTQKTDSSDPDPEVGTSTKTLAAPWYRDWVGPGLSFQLERGPGTFVVFGP